MREQEPRRTLSRRRKAALATAILAVPLVGANVLPSAAQQPPPPPIATEFLSPRSVFPDDGDSKFKIKHDQAGTAVVRSRDLSRTVVARFTVQPGAQFPWHSHRGPVVVNVTQGELVYVPADDCEPRAYPAGTAFVDAGHGHVHTAFNRTNAPTILVATFYEAPAEGPLLIPAPTPEGCSV